MRRSGLPGSTETGFEVADRSQLLCLNPLPSDRIAFASILLETGLRMWLAEKLGTRIAFSAEQSILCSPFAEEWGFNVP
jgi:hypothetical protein